MGKVFGIFIVWVVVLGGGALAYKVFILDKDADTTEAEKDKDKPGDKGTDKKTDTDGTVPPAGSLTRVKLALDSFSGYCVFRSPEFKKRLAKRGLDLECVDDQADYGKRMGTIKSGDTPLAVFTIDALITQSAKESEPPAAIVMLIDETRGADAMISWKDGVKDIDALNHKDAKIVLTPDTPSETLARVVRNRFNLPNLPLRKADYLVSAKDAEDVLKKFLDPNTRRSERKAYVLWEPYVTTALAQEGAQLLIDSSQFKGFIVDVLVVQRAFLRQHLDQVETIVRTYQEVLHETQQASDGMTNLVLADAEIVGEKVSSEQAKQVVKGIWWKNMVENYDHFGMLSAPWNVSSASKDLQRVSDMIRRITHVLDETRQPGEPSLVVGRSDKLIDNDVLERLVTQKAPFLLAAQTIRDEQRIQRLSPQEWKNLKPVGSLKVKTIEFTSTNKKQLKPEAKEELKEFAGNLKLFPQYYLRIEGHTANAGDREANMALAGDRAKAVKDYLVQEMGIEEVRLIALAMEPGGGKEVRLVALTK